MSEARKPQKSLDLVRQALEHGPAMRAYEAGFGAGEWEAFLTSTDKDALAALRSLEEQLEAAVTDRNQSELLAALAEQHVDDLREGLHEIIREFTKGRPRGYEGPDTYEEDDPVVIIARRLLGGSNPASSHLYPASEAERLRTIARQHGSKERK